LTSNSCTTPTFAGLGSEISEKRIDRSGSYGSAIQSSPAGATKFSLSSHNGADPQLSAWARSGTKRLFDCACILPMIPLLLPVLALVAVAVRLTSDGPIFFLQGRMGRHGKTFTILKFRTMVHFTDEAHTAVATADNPGYTPVGLFLRRYKLDELPQLFNVLMGHMSLVGPRPKLPEHTIANLPCRPGITGAATIAFALEESALVNVPKSQRYGYYHSVILPVKHSLDAEYMATSTFLSDFHLITRSVLRRWDTKVMDELLKLPLALRIEERAFPDIAKHVALKSEDRSWTSLSGEMQLPDDSEQDAA